MSLAETLELFKPSDAEEAADLETMRRFLQTHPEPFDRRILEGHFTSSALVLTRSGRRVLLLFHRKLGRWLQPGGHAEPGESEGTKVALREALEETGIRSLVLHEDAPRPLDIDVHDIPLRGSEPAHLHLDLRYLVLAPEDAVLVRAHDEAADLRFFEWSELPGLGLDHGLSRALRKARAFFP
jgi:8-oxo-dGTP pyrophosphatase MutT (NUDIX family)